MKIMKKRLGIFMLVLALALVGITGATQTTAKAYSGYQYVSATYLRWDPAYRPDRGGIGHYIVTLDSGYLNVRDQPSSTGNIIGRLYNGDKITTDATMGTATWVCVTAPWFY